MLTINVYDSIPFNPKDKSSFPWFWDIKNGLSTYTWKIHPLNPYVTLKEVFFNPLTLAIYPQWRLSCQPALLQW